MRRHSWQGAPEQRSLRAAISRRAGWFLEGLTPGKLTNMIIAGAHYAAGSERVRSWPVALKIDISPCCNLHCPTCVHAGSATNERLARQSFRSDQRMSVEELAGIVDEVRGRSTVASLYYLGDPLMHPDLCDMCRVAWDGGLNVHISTSFSFALSDDRIKELINSGLTHLSVCVDGLSQEKYELTRAGGRIDHVLQNLRRACAFRRESGRRRPRIEVQYLMFQHNTDELEAAMKLFTEMGVDDVVSLWGSLHNYIECDPGTYSVRGPKPPRFLPQCYWPYLFMVIKYNGDVVPCCNHRVGAQYGVGEDPRAVGNVFEMSVFEVWNSAAYQAVRRFVSNPELVTREPELKESFCHECARIFDTDRGRNVRSAEDFRFDELYSIREGGVAVRTIRPRRTRYSSTPLTLPDARICSSFR